MSRRGDVEIQYIVSLVIAIVGFMVVLLLLLSLNFENSSDDQVCRLSILSRATLPSSGQGLVPLKCTTKKICITYGSSGKCDQFAGEKGITYVRLSKSKDIDSKAEIIERQTAEAMYNCWTMMGEGRLDLFEKPISVNPLENIEEFLKLSRKQSSCVICSRVALAKDVLGQRDLLEKVDVNDYLFNQGPENSEYTYSQLFTDSQIKAPPKEFKDEFGKTENNKAGTDQLGIVFMQIKTSEDWIQAGESGAIVTGAFLVGSTVSLGATGTVLKIALKHPLIALVSAVVVVGGTAGLRAFGAAKDQELSAGYCGRFNTASEDKNVQGCSVVTPIDYNNVAAVNQLCGVIEGNP